MLSCQLSPDISPPLVKTHLAPRPLPSAVPRTVLGRDLLHGQCEFPAQVLPAQV